MPSSKKKRSSRNKKHTQRAPKDMFVTNFLVSMQRYPSDYSSVPSRAEEDSMRCFFVRVAEFASNKPFAFNPSHLCTAFMIANYPDNTLQCFCNPFRPSLLHRSLDFVGACFQAAMEANPSEDAASDDFLSASTADNFFRSLVHYMETLKAYSIYYKGMTCRCTSNVRKGCGHLSIVL
jgi:hypothetical protein